MDERGLYPIFEQWHIPFWQTTAFKAGVLFLLGVLLLIGIFFLLKRYWKKNISPAQRALHELIQLRNSDIRTIDQAQAAYFELTAILKRFFDSYYKRPYQGMTDSQMMDALKETSLPAEQRTLLQETVDASSGVKYARQDIMQAQFTRHVTTSINLIKLLPQPVRVDGAKRMETSPLGSSGSSIEANGGKNSR